MAHTKISRRRFLFLSAASAAALMHPSFTSAASIKAELDPDPVLDKMVYLPAVQKGMLRGDILIADILTGQVGNPTNFNDWVGWKWRDRGLQNLAFEPLWSADFSDGTIIPGAATGDPIYNANFTEMTVHLRGNIQWDDGVPFTAADLIFTVETLIAHDGFNTHSFFDQNVATVTAVDDLTVRFTLKQPNSRFHTTFVDRWGCTYIMPKHIFEHELDPVNFEFNPPVGLGPYKLLTYNIEGKSTTWVKRLDWDKTPTGQLFGEPKPKYIQFKWFANEDARMQAQMDHQADVLNLSFNGLKNLLSQSPTSRGYQTTYPWMVNNDPAITGITYNTAREPFDLADVRWALPLAIDYVQYAATAFAGSVTMSPLHIPHLGSYPNDYIVPMQNWLKALTIDVGGGEQFAVYDPDMQAKVVAYAKGRGFVFPEDKPFLDKTFGIGWFKYAPAAAEKLLKKNGFTKSLQGKWLKPGGALWEIAFLTGTNTTNPDYRNALAAVEAWNNFGINAEILSNDDTANLQTLGDFDVCSAWPAVEPWGAGPDLYRSLDPFHSSYVKPLGEATSGHVSRWSSATMDAEIANLFAINPTNSAAVIQAGTNGLKELIKQMPSTPTFGYVGAVAWDQTYWTNWPGAENNYTQPYSHWGPFKYMTPFLQPNGG